MVAANANAVGPTERVRRRVVVLGGGFAGINAAMALAKLPVDVTLVDRKIGRAHV